MVNLYAKWVENSYNIVYNANKPINASSNVTNMPTNISESWKYDQNAVLAAEPVLVGWRFEGWYSDLNCQTKVGNARETVIKPNLATEGVVHLYAKWVENSYQVIYNSNNPANASGTVLGLPINNSETWTYDQNAMLASAPSLNGWTFTGWYKDADCKIKVGNASEMLTKPNLIEQGNCQLYAGWIAKIYTITYNANKPTNASGIVTGMASQSIKCEYDKNVMLASSPTLTGWTFTGWYKDANCQLKVGNANEWLTKSSFSDTDNIFLFAGWVANSYVVTLNATENDGFCEKENLKISYDSAYGNLPEASKSESNFIGWYTEPVGGIKIENNTILQKTQNHTIYAHFEQNLYYLDAKLLSCSIDNGYNYDIPDKNANDIHFYYKYEFGKFVVKNAADANQNNFELNQKSDASIYFRVTYDCGNLPLQDSMTSRYISDDPYSTPFYKMPGGDIGNRTVHRGLLVVYITYQDGTIAKRTISSDIFKNKKAGDEILIASGINKPCKVEIAICLEFQMWAPGKFGISDDYFMNYRINQTLNFK